MSPPPPFISFPKIYCIFPHLTRHLLFHFHCPLHLCHLHFCPAFTVLCLLSPPTLIVYFYCLGPLLSPPPCDTIVINLLVYYDLSDLFFSILFTIIVMYRLICSSLLFSLLLDFLTLLIYSLLAPLFSLCSSKIKYSCSTVICHIFLHLPSLRSPPIQSDHPPQLSILNSDCSTHSTI